MPKSLLSIIIPLPHSESRLALTLIDIERHLSERKQAYEILVVAGKKTKDDPLLSRIASLSKKITVLTAETRGRGALIKRGIRSAKGNGILTMSPDNSIAIVEYGKMLPYIGEYPIIIGSRLLENQKSTLSLPEQFQHWAIRGLILHGISDAQCAFKYFSNDAATKIARLSTINSRAFDIEALSLAQKLGLRIKEIPVFYAPQGNHPKGRQFHWKDLWNIWWRLLEKLEP